MPGVELLDPAQNGRPAGQLESKLRHLAIGQEEAIQQIVRAHQTYLAGLSPVGRPIRTLSVLWAYRLWEDACRGGDCRIPVTELLCSNQDRLRRVSTYPLNRRVDRGALEARYRAAARATIVEPDVIGQIHHGDCICVTHEDRSDALMFGREPETAPAWGVAGRAA